MVTWATFWIWDYPLSLERIKRDISNMVRMWIVASTSERHNATWGGVGQDGSDWSRDLATSTFDLGGHGACGWCGSSSFVHIPSLKFVGAFGRGARRVSALMGLVTLTSDLLTLKLVCESHQVGNLSSKFGHARPFGSRIIRYVRDWRTGRGQTKATLIAAFTIRAAGLT